MAPSAAKLRSIIKRKGLVRPRELEALGVSRRYLRDLEASGEIERHARGLYAASETDLSEHHSLAIAAKRVPAGIVCLLSALRYHDLTTQSPHEVWLAIDTHARTPELDYPPLRVIRMRHDLLRRGTRKTTIDGVLVRITTPARTVADCFKFRNKIGLDVALEALREFRRSRRWTPDDLWRYAALCRVTNILRPYLEAIG
jgi:predicted transcriptional regulator of viral defense system